jgi:ParB-like chromosome segregation protein Spo0J
VKVFSDPPFQEQIMQIEMRPIGSVRPYDNNPRINDAAVAAIAASIKEFGFRQPLVVDAEGVIVVGHTRYKAALLLGMTEVPVHVAHGLTPAQAQAYGIADNQTTRLSEFAAYRLPLEPAELLKLCAALTAAGTATVRTLSEMLKPANSCGLRLGAARAILEMGNRAREQYDLVERIAALEARLLPGPGLADRTES